jgi:hypothetical protein
LVATLGAVGLLASTGAAARGHVFVMQADRVVGGVVLGRTTAPQAAIRFEGEGPRRVTRGPGSCVVTWPQIGLTVTFGTLGVNPPDACREGVAFGATVTSRSRWRTVLGLRVGDSTSRLRALYPLSELHLAEMSQSGYWLITRRMCAEVGGGTYPGLLARVRGTRVSALVASVGICE